MEGDFLLPSLLLFYLGICATRQRSWLRLYVTVTVRPGSFSALLRQRLHFRVEVTPDPTGTYVHFVRASK